MKDDLQYIAFGATVILAGVAVCFVVFYMAYGILIKGWGS